MKHLSRWVFPLCYIAYVMLYVSRVNLSMAAPELKDLAILNTEQIGVLGSLFSIVYAGGRLLSGGLCDRKEPWKMIGLGLLLSGISNLLIGTFPPFWAIAVLWSTNALAQSFLWGAILRILSAIYPADIAKKRAAYMASAVAMGNLVGIVLHSGLIGRFGAAWAFLFPGGVTLVLGGVTACFLRRVQTPLHTASQAISPVWKDTLLRRMLLPAMIHGVMKDNISLWMTVYIVERYAVDLQESSLYVLLIPLIGLAGRLTAPWFFRLSKKQERPLLLGFFVLAAAGSLLLVWCAPNAWVSIGYLSLIYLAVSVINACFLAFFPIRYAQQDAVATVSGVLDFATYLGAGLSALVFGVLIEHAGYSAMFLCWAGLSVVAVLYLLKRVRSAN